MINENPYQAPALLHEAGDESPANDAKRTPYGLLVLWTVFFSLNLIIPVLLGAQWTQRHGAIGMIAAVLMFWIGGGVLCLRAPKAAVRILIGAGILAGTQLLPIIHIVVGMVALNLAKQTGLIGDELDHTPFPLIKSELGGFVVTCMVGGMLMALVTGMGWLSALVFPGQRNHSAVQLSRR